MNGLKLRFKKETHQDPKIRRSENAIPEYNPKYVEWLENQYINSVELKKDIAYVIELVNKRTFDIAFNDRHNLFLELQNISKKHNVSIVTATQK